MDINTIMIIIWAAVIAVALIVEFLSYSMVSTWFAVGAVAALVSAACKLYWPWQIAIFAIVSLICIVCFRRFVLKFIKAKTVATNLDANVGKRVKLLKDVTDGRSEIKINDITWTVSCDEEIKQGETVEIVGMAGNKYIVKSPSAAGASAPTEEGEKIKKRGNKK